MTHIERKSYRWSFEVIVLDLVGLGMLFTGWLIIPGICLMVWANRIATKRLCANCGAHIKDRDLRMCPVCRERIE